jgi:hypothetical protein
MLVYMSVYILAAVLIFQGANLLVETSEPTKVVPPEVRQPAAAASPWGGALVACGVALVLAGLLSHAYGGLKAVLVLRDIGFLLEIGYGSWLVLSRKVDYTPAPVAHGDAHGHGH